jgi:hypothetical protein
MSKTVSIRVTFINSEILETPQIMEFGCGTIIPVGLSQARNYDANDCIVVRKGFTFLVNSQVFGTDQFDNIQDFTSFLNTNCAPCGQVANPCCFVTHDGCFVTYQGQIITYKP